LSATDEPDELKLNDESDAIAVINEPRKVLEALPGVSLAAARRIDKHATSLIELCDLSQAELATWLGKVRN